MHEVKAMTNILYMTVVEDLKDKIMKGIYQPGDMLKSESEMMKEYSVSRMTLRKSLSLLSNAGYIYSVPGKGHFVCEPETDLYQFRFQDYDSLACEIDKIKLTSVKIEDTGDKVRDLLGGGVTGKNVVLERMAFCAKNPVAIEMVYFPYVPHEPVVEEKLHFANYPKALETRNLFALKKELSVQLVDVPEEVGEKLQCNQGEPVFLITKKVRKKDTNAIISVSKFYIKKEYFSIKAFTPEEDDSKKIF